MKVVASTIPPLMTLPTENLCSIFETVNKHCGCDAVSFGLINRRLYEILKRTYPTPIFDRCGPNVTVRMDEDTPYPYHHTWRWKMQYIIGNFLGPNYRRRLYNAYWYQYEGSDTAFLNRSVYGDSWTVEEKDLNDRWYDWKHCGANLLRPYGLGEECLPQLKNGTHTLFMSFETIE